MISAGVFFAQAYGEPLARRVVRHKFADCRISGRDSSVWGRHASTRSLPARMCSITKLKLEYTCTWPPAGHYSGPAPR